MFFPFSKKIFSFVLRGPWWCLRWIPLVPMSIFNYNNSKCFPNGEITNSIAQVFFYQLHIQYIKSLDLSTSLVSSKEVSPLHTGDRDGRFNKERKKERNCLGLKKLIRKSCYSGRYKARKIISVECSDPDKYPVKQYIKATNSEGPVPLSTILQKS